MPKAHKTPIANTAIAFNKVYAGLRRPPWDVDGPTPFVQDIVQAGQVRGEVLDAGCGTGENAIYLAGQGYRVVAFDAAPVAIEKARIKARQRDAAVTFAVEDARELMAWDGRFDTIIDSGLFHVMGKSADRLRYARALRRVSRPGAVLHLLAFKDRGPLWLGRLGTSLRICISGFGTHGVTEEEIQVAFSKGWTIESIEERLYGWGTFRLARIRRV
ncbi:MAG TPA: class I SAM-dependent methyltransferase [Candidatus Acidoferrum sp.]|nr:class I SAM-dependent methyltransferase [Candidatus Acidoferrum sp.]